MLSPDARTVAIDLLRAPPGYSLEFALLTTYSLDLETMLALPLAVLSQADGGVEELLQDPLLLLEALRQAGERVHVFVDQAGMAIPRTARELYAMLEPSVHPVRAPNGGVFHPKVWVARFVQEGQDPLLRVAVLSRNLTFDRCWDLALVSEASPATKRRSAASRPLSELLQTLPALATESLPESVQASVRSLADEVERTRFPGPEGFDDEVAFRLLGIRPGRQRPWRPESDGSRLLAVSPFVNRTALDAVAAMAAGGHALVSRQEELDNLPAEALAAWDPVLVLSDAAHDEPEDATSSRPSGLHAKAIAVERGWDVTWYVGSANLTAAAFTGTNVELMASLTAPRGRKSGTSGRGIERFLEEFGPLCARYQRIEREGEDTEAVEALERIERARDELVAADLRVVICSMADEGWTWKLEGKLNLPVGVEVAAWPISLSEEHARALELPSIWTLPTARLTVFVAFRLRVPVRGVDDIRLTRKLPAEGMPEGRIAQVLRSLVDSPERLLRFLRALLGGLEGMVDWGQGSGDGNAGKPWGPWLGGEALLEDLVRVASRDPSRLEPVRRLIRDLRAAEDGRSIVPDDLLSVWTAVDEALGRGARP